MLPGVVDDLIYRTNLYARAGMFHSDLKVSDILVRRRSNGDWEARLSDFDRTYTGIAVTPTDGTLMVMTLLPMALTFSCNSENRLHVISAQMVSVLVSLVHTPNQGPAPFSSKSPLLHKYFPPT